MRDDAAARGAVKLDRADHAFQIVGMEPPGGQWIQFAEQVVDRLRAGSSGQIGQFLAQLRVRWWSRLQAM